jgi:hypothetical protein
MHKLDKAAAFVQWSAFDAESRLFVASIVPGVRKYPAGQVPGGMIMAVASSQVERSERLW